MKQDLCENPSLHIFHKEFNVFFLKKIHGALQTVIGIIESEIKVAYHGEEQQMCEKAFDITNQKGNINKT